MNDWAASSAPGFNDRKEVHIAFIAMGSRFSGCYGKPNRAPPKKGAVQAACKKQK